MSTHDSEYRYVSRRHTLSNNSKASRRKTEFSCNNAFKWGHDAKEYGIDKKEHRASGYSSRLESQSVTNNFLYEEIY